MSDLIEDCEDDLEFGVDADLDEARVVMRGASEQQKRQMALKMANSNPDARCPRGMVRSNGKCVDSKSVTGRKAIRSIRAASPNNQPAAEPNKKPSLIDRMKAMFGKK